VKIIYYKPTNLDYQGIGNSTKKLIVCSIKLTSALINPKHVWRAIIKEFESRIFTGKYLLIWKQQTFIDGGISLFTSEWESLMSTFIIVQI
jgi:hypothetical protein